MEVLFNGYLIDPLHLKKLELLLYGRQITFTNDKIYYDRAGYRIAKINGIYKLEHRFIWEQHYKACLVPKIGAIHHINERKADNEISNLKGISKRQHGKLHEELRLARIKIETFMRSWL